MKPLLKQRLLHQRLAARERDPVAVVRALLAVQAQEYWGGLWAVGVRTRGATEASVEAALVRGDLLRSHPMRGTHHLVAREDLRWLIGLMGPLMIRRSARRNRELGLDERTLSKSMRALRDALEGGRHLTRAQVGEVLLRAGADPAGQRLPHIIYRAELEALVCSGARQGKQVTVALFDERVPAGKPRPREEALAELARRYFATRAPATLDDFAWWCQLPMGEVREAVSLAGVDVGSAGPVPNGVAPRALALPPYDEYTVSYRDRSAAGAAPKRMQGFAERSLLGPNLVLEGEVVGTWWREGKRVQLEPWRKPSAAERAALEAAAGRYLQFVGG